MHAQTKEKASREPRFSKNDVAAMAVIQHLKAMRPLFSKDDLSNAERTMGNFHTNLRIAFLIGTKSGKALIKMVAPSEEADAETLAAMLAAVRAARKKIEAMQELVTACEARFVTALCYREDMQETIVLAECMEAENNGQPTGH